MPKPFLTYTQQIDKLRNEKILLLMMKTQQLTHFIKSDISNSLVDINTCSRIKRPGNTRITHILKIIVALYTFDEALRELNLKYILKAEQHLKSLISYHFCDRFGESQTAYLTQTNYEYTTNRNKQDINKLVKLLGDKYVNNKTDYLYIEHTKTKHGNLPLWVLINALTFGNISKMYSLFTQSLRISISKNYACLNEKQLGQITTVLTKFRNACAHGERLFTYKTSDSIPDLPIHKKLGIAKKGVQYIYGKNDLFSVVISLRYMLTNEQFKDYKEAMARLINNYVKNSVIPHTDILKEMGFPLNWKDITKYKKL